MFSLLSLRNFPISAYLIFIFQTSYILFSLPQFPFSALSPPLCDLLFMICFSSFLSLSPFFSSSFAASSYIPFSSSNSGFLKRKWYLSLFSFITFVFFFLCCFVHKKLHYILSFYFPLSPRSCLLPAMKIRFSKTFFFYFLLPLHNILYARYIFSFHFGVNLQHNGLFPVRNLSVLFMFTFSPTHTASHGI